MKFKCQSFMLDMVYPAKAKSPRDQNEKQPNQVCIGTSEGLNRWQTP